MENADSSDDEDDTYFDPRPHPEWIAKKEPPDNKLMVFKQDCIEWISVTYLDLKLKGTNIYDSIVAWLARKLHITMCIIASVCYN